MDIKGVLIKIVYYNEENQYCVGVLEESQNRKKIPLCGILPNVKCGETLKLSGNWKDHPQHGKQFKVDSFTSILPSDIHGIRKYLGSGLIPGIGANYADKIVNYFKEKTLDIINQESSRLQEIPGIGRSRARKIKDAWEMQSKERNLHLFLKKYGVTNQVCRKLLREYGSQTASILRHEPYRIALEIQGIGFKTADQIARNQGLPNDNDNRIHAGLIHVMHQAEEQGNTCLYEEILLEKTKKILEISLEKISAELSKMVVERNLRKVESSGVSYQLPILWDAEREIVRNLCRLQNFPLKMPLIKIPEAIQWAEKKASFDFAKKQKEAIFQALSQSISVLTGGPGTGKTTILRALVDILKAKKVKVVLAAPTGRAAQRMSESCGLYAQTLHRLLKMDPLKQCFSINQDNPLQGEFFIIDESSMLDTRLFKALIRSIPNGAPLLLVGDANQLPSVGAGTVLQTLIKCSRFPVTVLDEIFRQKQGNSIVRYAWQILKGIVQLPESGLNCQSSGIHFIKEIDPNKVLSNIVDIGLNSKSQILVPLHKGSLGITAINAHLQANWNPHGQTLLFGNKIFRISDRVLQTRNNYEKQLYNGDLGLIEEVVPNNRGLKVLFGKNLVTLDLPDLADLELAYAMSIHKSQGSEFPNVIIPLVKQHFVMLRRNLIYTAVTRGKKRVIVIGDPQAWILGIRNQDTQKRQSNLDWSIESCKLLN